MGRPLTGKPLRLRPIRLDDDVWAKVQGLKAGYGTINEGLRFYLLTETVGNALEDGVVNKLIGSGAAGQVRRLIKEQTKRPVVRPYLAKPSEKKR